MFSSCSVPCRARFPIGKCLVDPFLDMMNPSNVALFAPALGRLLAEADP